MAGHDEYSRRVGRKMQRWRHDLDLLKIQASDSCVDKLKFSELLDTLEDRFSFLEERLEDLVKAPLASRDEVRKAVDKAWEAAAFAIDDARNQLLH